MVLGKGGRWSRKFDGGGGRVDWVGLFVFFSAGFGWGVGGG